jgi:tetratricopeptide (TPR) repeat protein
MARWITLLALMCSISILVACDQVDATRDFNHGIKFYKAKNYAASVEFFQSAGLGIDDPAISYNLALAHLALLNSVEQDATGAAPATASVPALEAVRSALQHPEMSVGRRAELSYIEARIHQAAGDPASERAALERALGLDPGYRPALRELVKLDEQESSRSFRERVNHEEKKSSPLVRLVVSLAAGGEPELVEALSL